jgi:large subunit ribosomal protein L25
MAERHTIQASVRTILGKETKRLRRAGELPGVVYGPILPDPISVTVDMKELDRMYHAYGSNLLVDISVDGGTYPVYMRTVTMNRMARQPQHVEFYAPNMRIEMTASVPVMIVGEPGNDTALVTVARESIDVRGLPDALPSSFEVDISALLEIDQAIYVHDLTVPEGVEVLTDGDEMIVKLSAPTLQREAEAEAAEELEAAAEAAEAEGAEEVAEDSAEAPEEDESGA